MHNLTGYATEEVGAVCNRTYRDWGQSELPI